VGCPTKARLPFMDMKSALLLTAVFAGFGCAFADEAAAPQQNEKCIGTSAASVAQIKAQEVSRVFVELKLQEIALSRANPIDNEKIALVRSQQSALNQELVKLAIGPLQHELEESLKTSRADNPRNTQLREKITKLKVEVEGNAKP